MSWWSELVREHYPAAAIFDTDRKITESELRRFARIILTEGVPFAFSQCPLAFEFGRQRAAEWIGVDPKAISMCGSARIGYSLAHGKFGRAFDAAVSDIDLILVDEGAYRGAADEYEHFISLLAAGDVRPRHEREASFWTSAQKTVPNNIKRGFIDQKYIPTLDEFPLSQKLGTAGHKFLVNVNSVLGRDLVTKAPFRVYRDWAAAIDQISYSLMRTLRRRADAQVN